MISTAGEQSSDSIDRRVSTAGYTAANPTPTVMQDPGTSQEVDNTVVPEDVCIIPVTDNRKTSLEKPNDYIELSLVACIFNFLFALVALSLSFRSRDRWRIGDRSGAIGYGLASMAMSVFAIVTTAIIVFVLVWMYVLETPALL